jgi:glutamyl-tRNA synthetase
MLLAPAGALAYDAAAVAKSLTDEGKAHIRAVRDLLAGIDPFDRPAVEAAVHGYVEGNGLKFKQVGPPLRVALTGMTGGPDLPEIMAALGKAGVLARLDRALSL